MFPPSILVRYRGARATGLLRRGGPTSRRRTRPFEAGLLRLLAHHARPACCRGRCVGSPFLPCFLPTIPSGGDGRTAVAAANTGRAEMVAVTRRSGDSGGGATGDARGARASRVVRHRRSRAGVFACCVLGARTPAHQPTAHRAPRASRGRSWARPAHRPPARGVERGSGARGSTSEALSKEARRANADLPLPYSAPSLPPPLPFPSLLSLPPSPSCLALPPSHHPHLDITRHANPRRRSVR